MTKAAPLDFSFVTRDPETMGGVPVFTNTRVPIKNLWDYMRGGYTLDDFPTMTRAQAEMALRTTTIPVSRP